MFVFRPPAKAIKPPEPKPIFRECFKLDVSEIKRKTAPVLKKHGVKKAGLFGSYARGEQKRGSDVDLLVAPPKSSSLLGVIALKLDLERVLGKTVDLVEYSAVKPALKRRILAEEVRFA